MRISPLKRGTVVIGHGGTQWDTVIKDHLQNAGIALNCPADNVSWHDAVAFCRWLSARLGYDIRLPTEWEWQQAATGGDSENVYPWGREWGSGPANTSKSKLRRTTAVGMYPAGTSKHGVMDLAGNVWEWCLNKRDNPKDTDIGGNWRVLRGGSWDHAQDYARRVSRRPSPALPRRHRRFSGGPMLPHLSGCAVNDWALR